MASQYYMQIINKSTGEVVSYAPGGAVEKEFVEDCVLRIMESIKILPKFDLLAFTDLCVETIVKRGVGIGRTQAHVAQDIRDGIHEALLRGGIDSDTSEVVRSIKQHAKEAITASIMDLKSEIRP